MNKFLFLLALLLCGTLRAAAQERRFRIMEWNVENLFDTIPSPDHDDAEFTPQGSHAWNTGRYFHKLSAQSRTIAGVGDDAFPELVALIEVENDSVVANLVRRSRLWRAGYDYIITHSPDVRGINVALLYMPHRFRPVSTDTIRIQPPAPDVRPTRDVLHVAGRLTSGDTLDVMVVHLPSRKGGNVAVDYRASVAAAVRHFADSLMLRRDRPMVVVTGDFNAWWPDACMSGALGLKLPTDSCPAGRDLYLLSRGLRAAHGISGTYKFRGEWNQLDHFVVNGRMLSDSAGSSLLTGPGRCCIADLPFLLLDADDEEKVRPFRTYIGPYYQGGISDHLPLVLDLTEH